MNGRVLGFDFGLKRIGTASGSRSTGTTEPLTTIISTRSGPNWTKLEKLIREWRADELVVGLPLHMDGSDSDISDAARQFGDELAARTGLPVALMDERLSTREAEQVLELGSIPGRSQHRRRLRHRDNLAAELILKAYIRENSIPICHP